MHTEKWHVVGGHVYRLAEVFATGREAVMKARLLRSHFRVIISRDDEGLWAVYWRPKDNSAERMAGCPDAT